jgi:hypothetical protein
MNYSDLSVTTGIIRAVLTVVKVIVARAILRATIANQRHMRRSKLGTNR